jgi:23S rRNA (adenine2503-C2)-methyltransferase
LQVPGRMEIYMTKTDIKSLDYEQLQDSLKLLDEKSFRAKQIYEWIHKKMANSFDEMTNLSKELREKLKEYYFFT